MSQYVFKMPDLGEGTVDAEIVAWHTKPGDAVSEDQLIVEVMTDKAAVEVPAPVSGRVVSITGAPGDKVAVGSPLIVFDLSGDAPAAAPDEHRSRRRRRTRNDQPASAVAGADDRAARRCRQTPPERLPRRRGTPGQGHGLAGESAAGARGRDRFDHGGGVGPRRPDTARRSGRGSREPQRRAP